MRLSSLPSKTGGFIHKMRLALAGTAGFIALLASCANTGADGALHSYGSYVIAAYDPTDVGDTQWADYLTHHLTKRAARKERVVRERKKDKTTGDHLRVVIDLNPGAVPKYDWHWSGNELRITAARKDAMLWMLYQFMANLGAADTDFTIEDLPQPYTKMGVDGDGILPFEYRSIYSPSNRNEDLFGVTGSGNLDFDWAIWGHNLHKVIGDNLPEDVFALSGSARDHEQYCFSSEQLYQRLEHYILDQYGDGVKGGARFVIMPNDNAVVCQCPACLRAGNTAKSATPAVSAFITRLAKRFPHHTFFTSSYASVVQPPTQKFPANVGVLISAMDLPQQPGFTTGTAAKSFEHLLARWAAVCDRIYVWDYMRNFDDYFTPYPVLKVAQERLKFFRRLGVKGVVYNGSGEDFSSFDATQTYVLSALMMNPDLDVDVLVRQDLQHRYPEAGDMMADYYLGLENKVVAAKAELPYYGGIGDAVKAYLDPKEFLSFTEKLEKLSKGLQKEERQSLSPLLTAFNFTRLELMRLPGGKYDPERAATYLDNLAGHAELGHLLDNYREAFGNVDSYMANYSARPARAHAATGIEVPDHPELVDGYLGLPTDYHTNWILTPNDHKPYEVRVRLMESESELHVSALVAPRWKIYLPAALELLQDGKLVGRAAGFSAIEGETGVCDLVLPYKGKGNGAADYVLRIIPPEQPGKVTMGFDEISY